MLLGTKLNWISPIERMQPFPLSNSSILKAILAPLTRFEIMQWNTSTDRNIAFDEKSIWEYLTPSISFHICKVYYTFLMAVILFKIRVYSLVTQFSIMHRSHYNWEWRASMAVRSLWPSCLASYCRRSAWASSPFLLMTFPTGSPSASHASLLWPLSSRR